MVVKLPTDWAKGRKLISRLHVPKPGAHRNDGAHANLVNSMHWHTATAHGMLQSGFHVWEQQNHTQKLASLPCMLCKGSYNLVQLIALMFWICFSAMFTSVAPYIPAICSKSRGCRNQKLTFKRNTIDILYLYILIYGCWSKFFLPGMAILSQKKP